MNVRSVYPPLGLFAVPGETSFIVLLLFKELMGFTVYFPAFECSVEPLSNLSFSVYTQVHTEFLPQDSLFSDNGLMLASEQQVSLRNNYSQRTL